jgi:hypothetical protein
MPASNIKAARPVSTGLREHFRHWDTGHRKAGFTADTADAEKDTRERFAILFVDTKHRRQEETA